MKNQLILGDNLEVLKTLPSESVDLIYIDPPFFSNRTYEVIWGDAGEIASFNDRWAGGINHYIGWLYERVEELYRVLKPTGSFYLHCDWHANAYIRVNILDKIFGDKNFVNEIVWKRSSLRSSISRSLRKNHDTIFFYVKTNEYVYNQLFKTMSKEYKDRYKHHDEKGFYQLVPILVSGRRNGDTGKIWNGIDPNLRGENGMHWITTPEKLEEYRRENLLYIPFNGKTPTLKFYLQQSRGIPIDEIWDDINIAKGKERIGYPTQKPEALLERIIKASSNEGDIVLDAFCGGGTTCAVARRLGRKFIGIDQSVRAIAVSKARLENQTDLLTNDIYEVKTQKYNYDTLKTMDALHFETFIIEQFGGVPNLKQRGDSGRDGFKRIDGVQVPIQVKQQESVGRPVLQAFVGSLMQSKSTHGFFIAFDFAKTAYEYVAEIKQNVGLEVELVKVEDIIEIAKSAKIQLDWNYKTIDDKQHVFLEATGEGIELWQWDWDYDAEKGFASEVLKDTEGKQELILKGGKHKIAVRGIDADGIESMAFLTLYSNGSVHE